MRMPERQRENRDQRARRVEQEDHRHDRDDDRLLDELFAQRMDGCLDQPGTIVAVDEDDAFGQRRSGSPPSSPSRRWMTASGFSP